MVLLLDPRRCAVHTDGTIVGSDASRARDSSPSAKGMVMLSRGRTPLPIVAAAVYCVLLATLAQAQSQPMTVGAIAPTRHWNGQPVSPVYEGFDTNPDGSYNLWFGYLNRNFEEDIDVPTGPDNRIEPAGPDKGQPTHFEVRRHKDVFKV